MAAARKLSIRLYWMLRSNTKYPEIVRVESSSRVPLVSKVCFEQGQLDRSLDWALSSIFGLGLKLDSHKRIMVDA